MGNVAYSIFKASSDSFFLLFTLLQSHGEELHFVENGCHDNPTLDVTIDSQSEMQEKKPNVNGVVMDGVDNWHILINKTAKEEGDNYEEDTHL